MKGRCSLSASHRSTEFLLKWWSEHRHDWSIEAWVYVRVDDHLSIRGVYLSISNRLFSILIQGATLWSESTEKLRKWEKIYQNRGSMKHYIILSVCFPLCLPNGPEYLSPFTSFGLNVFKRAWPMIMNCLPQKRLLSIFTNKKKTNWSENSWFWCFRSLIADRDRYHILTSLSFWPLLENRQTHVREDKHIYKTSLDTQSVAKNSADWYTFSISTVNLKAPDCIKSINIFNLQIHFFQSADWSHGSTIETLISSPMSFIRHLLKTRSADIAFSLKIILPFLWTQIPTSTSGLFVTHSWLFSTYTQLTTIGRFAPSFGSLNVFGNKSSNSSDRERVADTWLKKVRILERDVRRSIEGDGKSEESMLDSFDFLVAVESVSQPCNGCETTPAPPFGPWFPSCLAAIPFLFGSNFLPCFEAILFHFSRFWTEFIQPTDPFRQGKQKTLFGTGIFCQLWSLVNIQNLTGLQITFLIPDFWFWWWWWKREDNGWRNRGGREILRKWVNGLESKASSGV
jgi:hypothetical protein